MNFALMRHLFMENAMLTEASRAWRKFWVGSGAPSGRTLNTVIIAMTGLCYIWLAFSVASYAEMWYPALPYIELLVITLTVPVSIYGCIAGERERATWEALILTRLTPGQIIFGKLLWRIGFVFFIMFLMTFLMVIDLLALPYVNNSMAARYLNAGVWMTLLQLQVMMLAWGTLLAGFGLWVSAGSRRTVSAAAVTFGSILFMLVLLPSLLSLVGAGLRSADIIGNDNWAFVQMIWLQYNPFYLISLLMETHSDSSGFRAANIWLFAYPGAALIYTIFAGLFIYGSHVRLRSLEEPKRK